MINAYRRGVQSAAEQAQVYQMNLPLKDVRALAKRTFASMKQADYAHIEPQEDFIRGFTESLSLTLDSAQSQKQSLKKGKRSVWERLEAVIEDEVVPIEKLNLFPSTSYFDDLEMDSIGFVEFIYALDEEFGVEIPDEDSERFQTVGDTAAYLEQRLSFQQISIEQQQATN